MILNRDKILDSFYSYVKDYDDTDDKIRLKIDHTVRVASLCEQIAKSENFTDEDVELAWLVGMLHDIGRFEQIRRFGTFSDADSIDHANFGADLLFEEGLILRFPYPKDSWRKILEVAIRNHSVYRLPEELSKRERLFCNLLRDADKIDIFRVNVDIPLEHIYNTTTEELVHCTVSEEVMNSFYEKHATLRSLKKTPVDHVAGHISLFFELVFPISVKIVNEQGYLNHLIDFKSENPVTKRQFKTIRNAIHEFSLTKK